MLLGPVIADFFYGRAEYLKNRMADAGAALRRAEDRHGKAIKKKTTLPSEIENRKLTLEESAKLECQSILEEAKKHSEYIIESARRAGLGELAKSEKEIRTELLEEAFNVAMQELAEDLKNEQAAKHVIDRGMRGLSGFSHRA